MDDKIAEQILRAVQASLAELAGEAAAMLEYTRPHTPLPEPEPFTFAGFLWPDAAADGVCYMCAVRKGARYYINTARDRDLAARWICDDCGWRPADILAAVRQIQAAAAWCRAKAEERRRLAEEILRRQADALSELLAEAAVEALR